MNKKALVLAVLSCAMVGCATGSNHRASPQMRLVFNAQVDRMTYDQAVLEFGKPDGWRTFRKTYLAEWKNRYETPLAMSGVFTGLASLLRLETPSTTSTHASVLKLYFDKKTNVLTDWSYDPG